MDTNINKVAYAMMFKYYKERWTNEKYNILKMAKEIFNRKLNFILNSFIHIVLQIGLDRFYDEVPNEGSSHDMHVDTSPMHFLRINLIRMHN